VPSREPARSRHRLLVRPLLNGGTLRRRAWPLVGHRSGGSKRSHGGAVSSARTAKSRPRYLHHGIRFGVDVNASSDGASSRSSPFGLQPSLPVGSSISSDQSEARPSRLRCSATTSFWSLSAPAPHSFALAVDTDSKSAAAHKSRVSIAGSSTAKRLRRPFQRSRVTSIVLT
jgi:hypothetical protein